MKEFKLGILGVPFDLGIKLVGGRPGARFAPKKVRQELFKLIKTQKLLNVKIIDYKNIIPVKNNVVETHKRVTSLALKIIRDGAIPIVIGGGHDISYGSVKALAQIYKKIGQINFDAHYDVRPVVDGKITSGTPFRRLLDEKIISGKSFVELGIHSPKNLPEHKQYLIDKNTTLVHLDKINKIGIKKALQVAFSIASKNTLATAFDIDIDGVQKRYAPGCSAPCVRGFTKRQILQATYLAGKDKSVKLFNLMEVSPVYDNKNKTIKLAAELILNFAIGLSKRK